MQFVNNLLDPEITKLRFWGEENLDYSIDENGIFYLNEEQGVRETEKDAFLYIFLFSKE